MLFQRKNKVGQQQEETGGLLQAMFNEKQCRSGQIHLEFEHF